MGILNLDAVTTEFSSAAPLFKAVSPGTFSLIKHPVMRTIGVGLMVHSHYRAVKQGADTADIVGGFLAGRALRVVMAPPRKYVTAAHIHVRHMSPRDRMRVNGLGGHSWYYKPSRKELVMVFHNANRAGPHVDVHIGRLSLVYRVPQDVYDKLRYNPSGMLTENSRKVLTDFVRENLAGNKPVPQNLDHSRSNAVASWTGGDPEATGYGAGTTRQVFVHDEADVIKAHAHGPIEFYAPAINPNGLIYLYRLGETTSARETGGTKAPIIIAGYKNQNLPDLEDKLHLKMIDPSKLDELVEKEKASLSTATAKYDGSSCYVVIDKKGTRVYSPRTSARTGDRIEYTPKLGALANVTSEEPIIAMGELLFREKNHWPFGETEYIPQARSGGILNSHSILPGDVTPEIRLYRVDKIGRKGTRDLPYFENRRLQQRIAALDPTHLKVVEQMDPVEALDKGFEGIVLGDPNKPVDEFHKVKFWQDADDWRIDEVALGEGPRGGIAGVVHLTSLESGKKFKLGPGQIGNHELNRRMMEDPEHHVGSVLKVQSRRGHEGRAAKVVAIHDDKGTSPL